MSETCRILKQPHAAVAGAVRAGVLAKLDGSIPCADCGAPATCYEHRDYGRPLDVEPVCARCNRRRGPAAGERCGPTSFRFDEETRALLDALADRLGLNATDVIRQALRHLGRREKVTIDAAMKAAAIRARKGG